MSLEPEWISTIYPALVCMVDVLLAMAFAVLVVTLLGRRLEIVDARLLNDLGSLLLAFVMLWAYLTYFQYMLIWSGNLADEITWFTRRTLGGWQPVGPLSLFRTDCRLSSI